MKFLLVGGGGYVGATLAQQLEDRGHEVLVARRHPQAIRGLTQEMQWDATTEWPHNTPLVDALVHLASFNGDAKDSPTSAVLNNSTMISNVLNLCERIPGCGVLYVSSIQVFGHLNGLVSNDTRVQPATEYAKGHWAAEQSVREFAETIARPAMIMRLAHVVGGGARQSAIRWSPVPADFCRQAVVDRAIRLRTSGQQFRDFMSISASTSRLADVLESIEKWDCSTHIIASGRGMSVVQLAEMVAEICETEFGYLPEISKDVTGSDVPEGEPLQFVRDSWNSIELCGPESERALRDSIAELLHAAAKKWRG